MLSSVAAACSSKLNYSRTACGAPSPGAVQAAAKGPIDDRCRPPASSKNRWIAERILGAQNPQRHVTRSQIFDKLLYHGLGRLTSSRSHEKGAVRRIRSGTSVKTSRRLRQFVGAAALRRPRTECSAPCPARLRRATCRAQPRHAVGGEIAAGSRRPCSSTREILIDRADDFVLRLQRHLIVGIVRVRAARGQRGQPERRAAQLYVPPHHGSPADRGGAEPSAASPPR